MLATLALVTLVLVVHVQLGRATRPAERRTPWSDLTVREVLRDARAGVAVLQRLSARR